LAEKVAFSSWNITFTDMSREAIKRKFRAILKASTFPKKDKRASADDGSQSAGVTSPLKPPSPGPSAAAAKALPDWNKRNEA